MATQRNPSFEILRVIAMLFIVVWHFLIHGLGRHPVCVADDPISLFNLSSIEFIGCLSKISTNCYVLITGYFLIRTTTTKWAKIPKTWAPIFFYSAFILGIFLIFDYQHISWEDCYRSLLPIYFDRYWFASRYLALVALAPFLAVIARNITRRQYLLFLGVMAVINCDFFLGSSLSSNNSIFWFIFLFFAGGYFRLYPIPEGKKNNFGKMYFLSVVAISGFYLSCTLSHYGLWRAPVMIDYHNNNGLIFVSAILLFIWATKLKSPDNRFVRLMVRVAPLTFGVYLIHDNILVRPLLWHNLICLQALADSWMFVPVLVGSCITIFVVCLALDSVRSYLFNKLRVNDRIDSAYNKIHRLLP